MAIAVVGDLDLASAHRLEREVAQQRAAGSTRLLIDLGEVDFIDSTGLRVLLALRNAAKRNANVLTLVPPSPAARRIFTITGTRALFDWEGDRAGLGGGPAPRPSPPSGRAAPAPSSVRRAGGRHEVRHARLLSALGEHARGGLEDRRTNPSEERCLSLRRQCLISSLQCLNKGIFDLI